MEKFYSILPTLPGLAGLYIRGRQIWRDAGGSGDQTVEVAEIITNQIIGDRDLKFPVPEGSLWISVDHLSEIDDPTKEYSTKSPFGEYIKDGSFDSDDIHVSYSIFDNAVTVTIFEVQEDSSQRTLFSQNFFKERDIVIEILTDVLVGKTDVEDLSLILQEIDHG